MSLRRLRAQVRLELMLLARNGENLLISLGIPVGMLLFFHAVPVLPNGSSAPLDALAPGALTVALMGSGMVALGISTAFEREYSVLRRYGVTPLRRGELVGAKATAVLAVQVVQVVVIAGVAVGLGWRPSPTPAGLLAAVAGLGLASAAFAGIGLAIAGRLPALRALAGLNALFVLLLFLGGVAVPLAVLPGPLAAVGGLTPTAWTVAVLIGSLDAGAPVDGAAIPGVATSLGALALWAAGALAVASRIFRWS